MKLSHLIIAVLALGSLACQTTSSPNIVQVDAEARASLFDAVKQLAGRWEGEGSDGEAKFTEFSVTSAGSAVREVMLPGEEHEMVNMYSLDGNSLVMTHYCAGGNQPRMRASSLQDGRLEFVADGVSDLKSREDYYMGAMTLVILNEDHVEQRWSALVDGELANEMVISMKRVR